MFEHEQKMVPCCVCGAETLEPIVSPYKENPLCCDCGYAGKVWAAKMARNPEKVFDVPLTVASEKIVHRPSAEPCTKTFVRASNPMVLMPLNATLEDITDDPTHLTASTVPFTTHVDGGVTVATPIRPVQVIHYATLTQFGLFKPVCGAPLMEYASDDRKDVTCPECWKTFVEASHVP
jgi:hypothetical protein